MKRFILSIILFWLSIISFWYWITVSPSASTVLSNNYTREYTCNWFCCIRSTNSVQSVRDSINVTYWWNTYPLFDTASSNVNYMGCFSYSWTYVLSQTNSTSNSLQIYNLGSFLPSTSCPTCPTCQSCNTWTINIYELSDPQYPVYSDSTSNWSFNYDIYYNDYVHYTRNWTTVYFTWQAIPECEECPESPSCPSTWEILSWYILESSIDSSYCIWGWFCPIDSTWSNWSSLFINWIQHESYPMINIDITDNVPWDYSINNDVFDLDVWEAYDQDFIDWVIDSQKTLPNKTDFNNTISWLIPLFVPWLVIILFLYFTFRFIKKIF